VATPYRALYRVGWWAHKLVWRLSGGRLGAVAMGLPALGLITIGRRSGERRAVLLNYIEHPDGYVVIASNAGDERDPAWWRNLVAHPAATVRIRGSDTGVRARELEGENREAMWRRFVAANHRYDGYGKAAGRHIPVVLLET
jgi:deazaflavin-dependent oxidoreductase (nitroreductase family)